MTDVGLHRPAIDLTVDQPATTATTLGALGVAVLFDIAVRAGVIGIGSSLCILAAAVVLIVTGRVRNPQAIALIAVAPVFGAFFTLRTSDWLLPLNLLVAAGCLLFGASLARGGSGLNLTIPNLVVRVVRGGLHGLFAPGYLLQGIIGSRRTTKLSAVARGLLIVTPIVLVVGALLRSADPVFASFLDVDASDAVQHIVLLSIALVTFGGLLRMSAARAGEMPDVETPKLGWTETTIVLVALNVLLGAFAAARIVSLSEGGRRVLESAGLTYAEYARSGFFQLLAVTVIVIGAMLLLRAMADLQTPAQARGFTILSLGVVALTLAVSVSAFHRLVLYEGAFGLTMLRVFVQTAIVWVGIVLVGLGVALVHRTRRAWLAPASAIAALALLLALNVFNPEAFVARHNAAHPPAEGLDTDYLSQLSDDAVPVIAKNAKAEGAAICASGSEAHGWASFNLATRRAQDVRDDLCGPTGGPR